MVNDEALEKEKCKQIYIQNKGNFSKEAFDKKIRNLEGIIPLGHYGSETGPVDFDILYHIEPEGVTLKYEYRRVLSKWEHHDSKPLMGHNTNVFLFGDPEKIAIAERRIRQMVSQSIDETVNST